MSEATAPLILTAQMPLDLYSWATQLRTDHYPPTRNVLKAHVTLFHALPYFIEGELRELLGRICAHTAPVPARLEGVMGLGSGTALKLSSTGMLGLRAQIAEHFTGMLTGQDSHPPRLHITVQNKVEPAVAETLHAELSATFRPRPLAISGLAAHYYRGGPWQHIASWKFRGRTP